MWTTRAFFLLTLLATVLLAPTAAAAGLRLTPQASSVAAGAVIRFLAEEFTPKEHIAFWATAPDQAVLSGGRVSADSQGRAELALHVPADAMSGTWAITAYDTASATSVVAYFKVVGRPGQAGPLAAVAPEAGPPGTTFTFAATGFDKRERASYWLTAPDGTIFAAFDRGAKANQDGRVDISWASPADALRGTWVLTIQGIESDVARGVVFHIQ